MDHNILLDYNAFRQHFTQPQDEGKEISGLTYLDRYGKHIERLNLKALGKLLFQLYGKWPHCRAREHLVRGAKRAIQTKYYENIYDRPISGNVQKEDAKCIAVLDLKDEPYQEPQPQQLAPKTPKPTKPKRPTQTKPQIHPLRPEVAQKVSEMDIEQLTEWAKKCGADKEKLENCQKKKPGLAKMGVGNLLKGRLRADPKLQLLVLGLEEKQPQGAQ